MHKSQSLFNLTTALHVSGVTITHLQEHKTTVTTASGNRYTGTVVCCYRGRVGTGLSVLWVVYAIPPIPATSDANLTVIRIKNDFPLLSDGKYFLISKWLALPVTAPPRSLAYLLVKNISGFN